VQAVSRAAGAVATEIQVWIDRETVARLVATLQCSDVVTVGARRLLSKLEARLVSAGGFDPRLQRAVLRHDLFAAVEARLGDPGVGDGCAAVMLALVRFNRDMFVGPVLMGPTVGALVAAAAGSGSAMSVRALNGLVAAICSPLMDELHARGELTRLIALLCAPPDPCVATAHAPARVPRPQGGGGRAAHRGPRQAPPLPAALRVSYLNRRCLGVG
jgi:hypothetical protein